jgi:thioester reductase-like protein
MATGLITGATGFLGAELVRSLLEADPSLELTALIRARDPAELDQRLAKITGPLGEQLMRRLTAVAGDVTRPRFGLAEVEYERLLERLDRVVHVAATTRFDDSLDEARRINVGGTEGALAVCRALTVRGRSGRLDYVGTAYVAGDRTDVAGEEELDVGQGFRNTYERSKLEAEVRVREARAELPVVIHRPSIIVGNSRTGQTSSYKTIYWPMKVLVGFYGLWESVLPRLIRLPVRPSCVLDLVPVDWVADGIARLAAGSDCVGKTLHLAAGPDAPTIEELVGMACDHFGVARLGYLDPEGGVRHFGRAARPALRRLLPRLVHKGELMLAYTRDNPRFDTTVARSLGLAPPDIREYFPRLIGFAYAENFGRSPSSTTT